MAASAATSPLTHEIALAHQADFAGWRDAARRLLAAGAPPETVAWAVDPDQPSLFEPAPPPPAASSWSVPRHLVQLAEGVVPHADPGRFGLLYRLLWRVTHGERSLLARTGDRDVARAEAMAAGVRRAAQKLRLLIRFREIHRAEGPHLVAWFEPEHHVLDQATPWFAAQLAGRRWSIVTPERSSHWDGAEVRSGPGGQRSHVPPPGADDAAWEAWAGKVLPGRPAAAVVPLRTPVARGRACVLVVESLPGDGRGDRAQRLLERAMDDAGLDASRLRWVRAHLGGKRLAVRRLDLERARLQPGLVLALGARAAEALLERPVALALERGRILPMEDGGRLLIAGDPAAILALADGVAQGREYRRLVSDLLLAVPFQARAA